LGGGLKKKIFKKKRHRFTIRTKNVKEKESWSSTEPTTEHFLKTPGSKGYFIEVGWTGRRPLLPFCKAQVLPLVDL
jgi:hypothetical protein